MYPEDAELAYITDNAVDFANDFVGKFYPDQMGQKFGEEEQANYVKNLT
jgi:hypothetical protein